MATMMIMGMPAKKAVGHVLLVGGSAAVAKITGDALGDRLFVQSAADQTAHPRDDAAQKMTQLYRGLVIAGGGLLVGKVLWPKSKDLALGIAMGATVSGLDRILTTYDVSRQISNVFRASDNQIPAPAANTHAPYNGAGSVRYLSDGRPAVTGQSVSRQRVAMGG